MTFSELKTEVKDRLGYTSTTADTRVGRLINKIYREVGTGIGMSFARQTNASATVTIGNANVTFTAVEKVLQVWRLDGDTPIVLDEVLLAEQRENITSDSDKPTAWALVSTASNSVTIRLNAAPETAYTLYADVIAEVSDLSGSNEPAFSESFHDILIEGVLKDEYRKLEKIQLARDSEATFQRRMSDLRMFVAKSNYLDIQQGKVSSTARAGTSGGSGSIASTALTITALWTFDRDTSAPFAVTDTSAYVANLFAEGVGNVTTDRLIGRDTAATGESEQLTVGGGIEFTGSGGIQRSALTGDVTASAGSNTTAIAAGVIVTADLGDDQVTYAKIQDVAANSFLARAAAADGDVSAVALAASQLAGRGSTGNIAAITLGAALAMSTTTLNVTIDDESLILATQVFA